MSGVAGYAKTAQNKIRSDNARKTAETILVRFVVALHARIQSRISHGFAMENIPATTKPYAQAIARYRAGDGCQRADANRGVGINTNNKPADRHASKSRKTEQTAIVETGKNTIAIHGLPTAKAGINSIKSAGTQSDAQNMAIVVNTTPVARSRGNLFHSPCKRSGYNTPGSERPNIPSPNNPANQASIG